jgi:hypothetical protein
MGIHEASEHLK